MVRPQHFFYVCLPLYMVKNDEKKTFLRDFAFENTYISWQKGETTPPPPCLAFFTIFRKALIFTIFTLNCVIPPPHVKIYFYMDKGVGGGL